MEVAGLATGILGLAGLYSTAIEVLDALSAAARFGIDRELLQTKIEVERVRLMVWGDAVGLTEIDLDPSKTEATEDDLAVVDESLQRTALRVAVAGLLACFVRTFEDVKELQKRYGLAPQAESKGKEKAGTVPTASTAPSSAALERPAREILSSTFRKTYAAFQDRTAAAQKQTSPLTRARWAVVDEPKFRALISELKAINDSLMSLLPAVRNKTRVKMRAEIMQSNDVGQLQNLVNAADDVTDLISETASLRLEMLSSKGQSGPRRLEPRLVQVSPAAGPSSTPEGPRLTPVPSTAEVPAARTPSPPPTALSEVATAPVEVAPSSPPAQPASSHPPGPPLPPYDDSGTLVIHKIYTKPDCLSCYAWLSGTWDETEVSEVQPPFHPAFALRYIPDSILSVAGNVMELDVEADPKYAGWSPGSTSLTGFAREVTFWRLLGKNAERPEKPWRRATNPPSLSSEFVLKRWKALLKDGLGKDWTERKGHDQVRELVGPSEYTWLDPQEGFKLRHQIADLLADMSSSPLPNLESVASIGLLANYEKVSNDGKFGFVDFLLQMVEAREVMLRLARSQRTWHGGITVRIVYDLITAELWGTKMDYLEASDTFQASSRTKKEQVDGIVRFAEEMKWPYLDEIRETANTLRSTDTDKLQMDIRTFDWLNGLVLPGAFFPLATVGTLYAMSPTLRTRLPSAVVQLRQGSYGLVYPQASYWSVRSVVGKVLAPMSQSIGVDGSTSSIKCLGGWVGPCPSPSLPESTFGLVVELAARPPTFVAAADHDDPNNTTLDTTSKTPLFATETKRLTNNAAGWTEPLSPPPPPTTGNVTAAPNKVTLQTLRLSQVPVPTDPNNRGGPSGDDKPPQYRARLDFRLARTKSLVTITLHTNSVFVAAPACRGGPHRVDPRNAAAYTFRVLEVEDLPGAEVLLPTSGANGDGKGPALTVINASGGGVAETFARAWCSQKGTDALVWERDGGRGCFKCALMVAGREGLGVGVVIVV